MMEKTRIKEFESAKRTVACFAAAERILAFKSRVEEAQMLIEEIPNLNTAIDQLNMKMAEHAMLLMKEAFGNSDAESSDPTAEKETAH